MQKLLQNLKKVQTSLLKEWMNTTSMPNNCLNSQTLILTPLMTWWSNSKKLRWRNGETSNLPLTRIPSRLSFRSGKLNNLKKHMLKQLNKRPLKSMITRNCLLNKLITMARVRKISLKDVQRKCQLWEIWERIWQMYAQWPTPMQSRRLTLRMNIWIALMM